MSSKFVMKCAIYSSLFMMVFLAVVEGTNLPPKDPNGNVVVFLAASPSDYMFVILCVCLWVFLLFSLLAA